MFVFNVILPNILYFIEKYLITLHGFMNRKQRISLIILVSLFVLLYVADKFYFSRQPVLYPNFGIRIPAGYTTHGIDVSRYQKSIDWELVKNMSDKGQRISFAIIKATEGVCLEDPRFEDNWKGIQEVHLLRGAYLYFHPHKNGKTQAEFFHKQVELLGGDLPPIVDIEETKGASKDKLKKNLQDCLNALEEAYGVKPMIYSSVDFYERYLGNDFNQYPFWAAHYEQVHEPRTNRAWTIWQHNCKGRVNGIDAEVDFNVVNGSLYALKGLCL